MPVKMAPTSVIKLQLGLEKGGKVEKFATQTCAIHMDKYVPYKEGNLRDYDIDGNEIIYDTPYAHYMYEGILYVDPETGSSWARKDVTKVPTSRKLTFRTPGTGRHWDKRMLSAEKDQVIKEIQEFINRR